MSGERLLYICFLWMWVLQCEGITNNENQQNLIGEEERRGASLQKYIRDSDQKKSETKHGLWIIGQPNRQPYPSGYDSSGLGEGYQGYVGNTGYQGYQGGTTGSGLTGSGYTYDSSGPGAYTSGHTFGTGYAYSGGASHHYGNTGTKFGHSGSGHGVTGQGDDSYKKLALKKLLLPLAGLALLGAAAAWSNNPVLLQLGSISGRKRRKRSILERSTDDIYPANPVVKPDNLH